MSRRAATALVAVCAAVLIGAFLLWRRPAPAPPPATPSGEAPRLAAPALLPFRARLWLPSADGRLAAAELDLVSEERPEARAAAALGALLALAPEPPLAPVFPAPVAVHKVLLGGDGLLYVDLRPADGGAPAGAGSTEELQRVYAIVHTALEAAPEVRGVVLLWNGVQRRSLAGHVDTARPLGRFAPMEPR